MTHLFTIIVVIISTIAVYIVSRIIYKKYPSPLLLPVAVATAIIIVILYLFHLPYNVYMIGGDWISELLGPAVVALAYPLYQQRAILKELAIPITAGTFSGAFVGILTGVLLAKWAGFDETILYSLSPKSVTTPVAMDIADAAGGVTTLAAVFVMIAGIGGTIMSTYIFRLFHIHETIGRGVGIGSASHAIGTARAMENSQMEGSISTIAMILSALFVSILAPLVTMLFI